MAHNKFALAILIAGVACLAASIVVGLDTSFATVLRVEVVKLGNAMFRPIIPVVYAICLLYFFGKRGNNEAQKIASDPIAIAIIIAGIAISVGLAIQ